MIWIIPSSKKYHHSVVIILSRLAMVIIKSCTVILFESGHLVSNLDARTSIEFI